jgi:hypothetical protein
MTRIAYRLLIVLMLVLAAFAAPMSRTTYAQSGLPSLCSGFQLQNTDTVNPATVTLFVLQDR